MDKKEKVKMIRVSESIWEKLMRMKLDLKKKSVDDLLAYILKPSEDDVLKTDKEEHAVKEDKEKHLAAG